ncbi:MAG TPA: DUF2911 domain-containing protein [Opitutaceae bacterium]|nr:DUF2911 domain-containing protein [Opitutaceae bacterium]
MNTLRSVLVASLVIACTAALVAQTSPAPATATPAPATPQVRAASTGGRSPHETTTGYVGGDRRTGHPITITYGRPYTTRPGTATPRKIWGGLVPWDKADRLGADEATLLITSKPLAIGETTIPAGAYTLYIVPSETGVSKLAFSKNIGKWGIPVDEKSDVARVDLKKETLPNPVDQLTIAIANDPATPNGGVLKFSWETTQFSLPLTVQK